MTVCEQIRDLRSKIQQFRDILNNPNRYKDLDIKTEGNYSYAYVPRSHYNENPPKPTKTYNIPFSTTQNKNIQNKSNFQSKFCSNEPNRSQFSQISKTTSDKPTNVLLRNYYYSKKTKPIQEKPKTKPVLFSLEDTSSDNEEEEEISHEYSSEEESYSESENSYSVINESPINKKTVYKRTIKTKRNLSQISNISEEEDEEEDFKDNFVEALVDSAKRALNGEQLDYDIDSSKDNVIISKCPRLKRPIVVGKEFDDLMNDISKNSIKNDDMDSDSSDYSDLQPIIKVKLKNQNPKEKSSESDSGIDEEGINRLVELYANYPSSDEKE
ncbi:hypothetical protein TVAG_099480 [Trichomonas vaginalis G3]|uniref:Uncharacterized protein n=1 Tax=Trichomonas vaginalis (strain ATCC PRA-98 / G3) TaxID=412133 RepID=A2FXV8_TRIV3|nr:hypothetical protein TVAGG3_0849320 [Trichomonas vaginalis G3]EAX90262.1 hypothetical protein TVAG_099480 [Trichomonas vaginalis G3]KAI5499864.1 hypothetical protein TVAGG3_0849320 [Trichomonas vaginalis G3]|eukprot:XP_001303192.1 hypothetical protein [Trichomonas vaginalis G3]